jgi:hypothetical protein
MQIDCCTMFVVLHEADDESVAAPLFYRRSPRVVRIAATGSCNLADGEDVVLEHHVVPRLVSSVPTAVVDFAVFCPSEATRRFRRRGGTSGLGGFSPEVPPIFSSDR